MRKFLLVVIGFVFVGRLAAQFHPDAGTLERELRETQPTTKPTQPPVWSEREGQNSSITDVGPVVKVRHFEIVGATLFTAKELEAVLSDLIGKSLSFVELEEAALKLAGYYRTRGYFARAYLPGQDVTKGDIKIHVVEGSLARVRVIGDAGRTDAEYVQRVVAADLEGKHYTMNNLERGLLLANDLPGIAVKGRLEAGEAVGTTDLALKFEPQPLVGASIMANNFGAKETGAYQGGTNIFLNNLSGIGDQAAAQGLLSRGVQFAQIRYNRPLGTDGLRVGAAGSYLAYKLGGAAKELDAEGVARTVEANISYPWLRSRRHNIWLSAILNSRRYHDDISGFPLHRRRVTSIDVGVQGDVTDSVGKGGTTRFLVRLIGGRTDLSQLPIDEVIDSIGPGTHGGYIRSTIQLSREQTLSRFWYLNGRVLAQWSPQNLDSSEQFVLGGPYGIRAYPVGEGTGTIGALGSVELHRRDDQWDFSAFIDGGTVRRYAHKWPDIGPIVNSYWLEGLGLGAAYQYAPAFAVQISVAAPMGSNRGSYQNDRNQDGSRRTARVWASVSGNF